MSPQDVRRLNNNQRVIFSKPKFKQYLGTVILRHDTSFRDCPVDMWHSFVFWDDGQTVSLADQEIMEYVETIQRFEPLKLEDIDKSRPCSAEGCTGWGQFRFCGIWICAEHTKLIQITWKQDSYMASPPKS